MVVRFVVPRADNNITPDKPRAIDTFHTLRLVAFTALLLLGGSISSLPNSAYVSDLAFRDLVERRNGRSNDPLGAGNKSAWSQRVPARC